MNAFYKTTIWNQFGAAIDMLENAIRDCPDELWRAQMWRTGDDAPEFSQVWYVAQHVLFWLDFYVSGGEPDFAPPSPFTLDELDPEGVIPAQRFTKDEILAYLAYGRAKCRAVIDALTEESAQRIYQPRQISFAQLLIYNLRHVQEHAAQINMFIGQHAPHNPRWVSVAMDKK